MPSRTHTSDPSTELLRTITPGELRTSLARFQERDPARYPEVRALMRDLAREQVAPANAEHADAIRTLRQAAPGLMDSSAALTPELAG